MLERISLLVDLLSKLVWSDLEYFLPMEVSWNDWEDCLVNQGLGHIPIRVD